MLLVHAVPEGQTVYMSEILYLLITKLMILYVQYNEFFMFSEF